MSVQEFESWLISDMNAVRSVLDLDIPEPPDPESLKPGEAKEMLSGWVSRAGADGAKARAAIAQACDFWMLAKNSRSFEEFAKELKHAIPQN